MNRSAGGTLQLLGAMVAAMGLAFMMSGPAQAANIVTNGGFETGDFTGWTLGGNTGFTGVECPGAPFVPEGNCDAFLGPIGTPGTLSQTLVTLPGRVYAIRFAFESDGGAPSLFSASFGGLPLINLSTPVLASPYHVLSFLALATGAATPLVFTFRDDPGFLHLDAVAVSIPEPATMALLGIGVIGLLLGRRKAQ